MSILADFLTVSVSQSTRYGVDKLDPYSVSVGNAANAIGDSSGFAETHAKCSGWESPFLMS
jgi:hypothetical protein